MYTHVKLLILPIIITIIIFLVAIIPDYLSEKEKDVFVGYEDGYQECIDNNKYCTKDGDAIYFIRESERDRIDKAIKDFIIQDKCDCNKLKIYQPNNIGYIEYAIVELKFDDTLASLITISLGIYLFILSIYLYRKCNHTGWCRLSLVFAIIPGLIGGYFKYNDSGRDVDFGELIFIVVFFIYFYAIGVLVVHAIRSMFLWVKAGFSEN